MNTPNPTANAMINGRRADSDRRRRRVLTALDHAVESGEELSVSAVARRARVDRTFLYRHRDLLERIHAAEAQSRDTPDTGPAATRASLQADLPVWQLCQLNTVLSSYGLPRADWARF